MYISIVLKIQMKLGKTRRPRRHFVETDGLIPHTFSLPGASIYYIWLGKREEESKAAQSSQSGPLIPRFEKRENKERKK